MSARLTGVSLPIGVKIAVVLMLVMGLYLLGVAVTAPPAPAQAQFVQPVGSDPRPLFVPTPIGGNRNGTVASFTALIPEVLVVNIPMVGK